MSQGLGGLRSKIPGGGNKSDKPATPKSGSSPLGQGLGGLRSKLPGGGNKSDKPATPKSGSGEGNALSRGFGSLRSKLPGGGDKPAASGGRSTSAPASSASSRPAQSSFGSARTSAPASSSSRASASSAASKKDSGGLGARLKGMLPFGGGTATKKPATMHEKVSRASRAPKVDETGLTLDNKLDILGVGLLLGSLALFFSSMSSTQGQLTQPILTALTQLLGWGAIAVPIIMFAVGIWLIIRHFGDEAPTVDPVRVTGVGLFYLSLLILFQYIDSFQSYYTMALLDRFLEISVQVGRGGGWVGAQLYSLLVLNITEIGGMFALAGMFIISIMFMLRITAAELAVFLISIGRSFNASRQRRAQARAARARMAAAAAAAQAPPQISVTRPAAAELPAETKAAPALPQAETPSLPEPRPIPITKGGRTVLASYDGGEAVPAEANTPAASTASAEQPAAEGKSSLAARLFNAVPLSLPGGGKSADAQPAEKKPAASADAPKSGGLFSRISSITPGLPGRGSDNDTPKPTEAKPDEAKPEAPAPAASVAGASSAAPASPYAPQPTRVPIPPAGAGQSAPSARPPFATPSPATKPEDTPARLGDLMRPGAGSSPTSTDGTMPERPAASAAPSAPPYRRPDAPPTPGRTSPFGKPADLQGKPAAPQVIGADDEDDDETMSESEELASLPPATARGTGPAPRPQLASTPFAPRPFSPTAPSAVPKPTDEAGTPEEADGDEDGGDEEQLSLSERRERLNALRSGYFNRASSTPAADGDKPAASAVASATSGASAPAADGDKPAAPAPSAPAASVTTPPAGDRPAATTTSASSPPPARPASDAAYPSDRFSRPAPKINYVDDPRADEQNGQNGQASQPAAFRRPETPPVSGAAPRKPKRVWKLPDFRTLLNPGSENDFDRETLLQRARIIEDTLQSFGAPGRVVEVNTGPVITQFGVEPDYLTTRSGKKNRVKVGAIAQLDKDLQLALGAKSIRIEAPVPGKGYVGIEVPNEEASVVSLRDVMESEEFQKIRAKSPLAIALGQSVDGTPIAADLASMPHLLVAGTTGSGKSVLVNAIISSLIISNPPDVVKFIMVDPKRVELTGYNGIPHLVAPVVVDLERTVGVLKWVTREMDERYKQFSAAGARNIEDFNNHLPADAEKMPYIVVIIDELADLMMLAPDETERVITRIAALARATGIHLVIATQRPSVDVVTGLIKANFPARVAFAVAGGVDSRVILDQPGAERLLGKGDMLYLSGNSPAPLRLQGVYVSDSEIPNITRYWKMQAGDEIQHQPITALALDESTRETPRSVDLGTASRRVAQTALWNGGNDDDDEDEDDDLPIGDGDQDELYDQAVEMVRRLNKASVSLLQRRLRIGYTRAARLIDMMEAEGIVGPAQEGSKPRDVLPVMKN